MKVTYEWVVETLDYYPGCGDDPDILDCVAFASLDEAHAYAAERCEEPWRICLRRDRGDSVAGLVGRHYAYADSTERLQLVMESCAGAGDGPCLPGRFWNLRIPRCPDLTA